MKRFWHQSIFVYLGLSLLVHAMIVLGIRILENFQRPINNQTVSVELIESTPAAPTSEPGKKIIVKAKQKDQQIVDQDEKAVNDEIPDEKAYLSRHNQKVNKQTVAKNKGEFQNKLAQKSAPAKAAPPPRLKDFALPLDPFALMQKQIQKQKSLNDQRELSKNGRDPHSNPATDGKLPSEVSQSPDYLREVDQGLETMLSTKEFKYYTYFNRIRRQLSQHWEPKVREKLNKIFRQGRSIASNEDKITKLVIFLNPMGQLVKVQVMSESGIRDLDEAAIDAFRAASPFPNPPQGIVDPDGFVKIRWDFVLEV